ncbi:MAG: DUF116 domain-containing protein [Deltaproteobacteria bacterium]|nr:DUF116 domain-containing protein [Deltaproteobacteria bacterium]MBW1930603.1 DUF116 domain-containing protein [Deltaproteobacteria bacterium]MBW2025722.1 DUF116 domain-containing protein [Deltaproteobacteria bacterium]MBW2124263.1 DUF116 domain-containing protein [Deltaproteobacteria bacterium]
MPLEEEKNRSNGFEPSSGKSFVLLLVLCCFVLVGGAFVLWWVPYVGLSNIHPRLPLILALCFAAVVLFGLGGALTLIFTIVWGRNLFINRKARGIVIRFLFPLLVVLGKLMGISKDDLRRSFIAVNNRLVLAEAKKVRPEKLLILLPHCLQFHECPVRITGNIENCKACGKCKIKDLVAISKRYGVSISVATGGTIARRIVVEKKPHIIIGVACERDLTSGIQDTYPIPVYGILNKRPHGPCFDTDVDLEMVERGILTFLENGKPEFQRPGPHSP